MKIARKVVLLLLLTIVLCSVERVASADTVSLKNGDRVSGTIVSMKKGKLKVRTAYAGVVLIDFAQVKRFTSEKSMKIYVDDKQLVQGVVTDGAAGEVAVASADGEQAIPVSAIKGLNVRPRDYDVKAKAELGWSKTAGNTDKESVYGLVDGSYRSGRHRVRLHGDYDWAEDGGETTDYNWTAKSDYDYFFSEKWFVNFSALAQEDRFQSLDLRTILGLGLGWQYEWSKGRFSVDGGPAHVRELYQGKADREFGATRWGAHLNWWIWPDHLQFFHDQIGFWNLGESDDANLQTRTGFRVPLYKGLYTSLRYHWDWRNKPAAGKEHVDRKYMLTIGWAYE